VEERSDAASTSALEQLQAAYLRPDAARFVVYNRQLLAEMHTLTGAQCATRQRDLIEWARTRGFDGLEAAWLMYQDCAAGSADKAVAQQVAQNHVALKAALRFRRDPVRSLPQRYSAHNSVLERAVRTDALRAVMVAFTRKPTTAVAALDVRSVVDADGVRQALCALPLLNDQTRRIAMPDLVRRATCLAQRSLGTTGNVAITCNDVVDAAAGGPRAAMLASLPRADLERLRAMCESRVAGGALGSTGIDGLDMFSEDVCLGAGTDEVAQVGHMADLAMECMGDGTASNPLAGGSSADAGTKPGAWALRDIQEDKTLLWIRTDDGDHYLLWVDSTKEAERAGMNQLYVEACTPFEKCEEAAENVHAETDAENADAEGDDEDDTEEESDETDEDTDPPEVGAEGTQLTFVGRTFNARNPACEELGRQGLLNGHKGDAFWDLLYARNRGVDPRTVYPKPDDQTTTAMPFCGPIGLAPAPAAAGQCAPVMCAGLSALDGSCGCSAVRAAPSTAGACFDVRCSEGRPTSLGVGICTCSSGETPPADGPPPSPLQSVYSEVIWGR